MAISWSCIDSIVLQFENKIVYFFFWHNRYIEIAFNVLCNNIKVLYKQKAMNKITQLKENNQISDNILHQDFIVAYFRAEEWVVCM